MLKIVIVHNFVYSHRVNVNDLVKSVTSIVKNNLFKSLILTFLLLQLITNFDLYIIHLRFTFIFTYQQILAFFVGFYFLNFWMWSFSFNQLLSLNTYKNSYTRTIPSYNAFREKFVLNLMFERFEIVFTARAHWI